MTSQPATISVIAPPTITRHPTNIVAIIGQAVTLSGEATGPPPLRYHWYLAGVALTNETNAILQIPSVNRSVAGAYQLAVSNPGITIFSSNALLRVLVPQRLLEPQVMPGDLLRLRFHDPDGHTHSDLSRFEIQAATTLKNPEWVVITNTLRTTNGTIQLDTAIAHPRRFFRVIER